MADDGSPAPRQLVFSFTRHAKAMIVLVACAATLFSVGEVVTYWRPWFWLVLVVVGLGALWYRLALKFVDEVWS